MSYPNIQLQLPQWLLDESEPNTVYKSVEDRMRFVIELSKKNIEHSTGGPFGAAVFETSTGKLIAPGVNVVVPSNCSLAHAESMALMLAQQVVGTYNLACSTLPQMQLVTASEPCIQCFGNIWWSGVTSVVTGARANDVEELTGFNEGPLPDKWEQLLARRQLSTEVTSGVLSDDAKAVLKQYKDNGGIIYNAG